jgi:MFS family permease
MAAPLAVNSTATLGRAASFWVSAAVIVHTLWTSAAPAMTYPLYAAEWDLTPTAITAIFAVYPIVVVAVLIAFGDLSDYIGRRATILLGLSASLFGVLLFAAAPDVTWVFIGRAFMGLGVGLSASPATAALVEFSPAGQSTRASAITTAAQSLGLTLATLVGGGLIQYAPLPARLNFVLLAAVITAIFVAAWFLPHHTSAEAPGRWRPKVPGIPRGLRKTYLVSVVAVSGGFALGSLILSLGSQIARDLVGSDNVLVNGAAIALFTATAGIVAVLTKPIEPRRQMIFGGISMMIGMGLFALSASLHALAVFLAAAMAGGSGYSLMFSGGLNVLNAQAPAHHRAGTISALFLVAYLTQGLFALFLGKVATLWGLEIATDLGAVVLAGFGVAAIALTMTFVRPVRERS